MRILKNPIFLVSILFVSLVLVLPVFAQETTASNDPTAVNSSTSLTSNRVKPGFIKERIKAARQKNLEIRENLRNRASNSAQKRVDRLSAARLRVCEARKKNITKRVRFMLERGEKINNGHLKIEGRVDEFYNNKLVSNGYELSNYEDLKADMAASKANVLTLLEMAKESGSDFDCNSDDPKGQVDAFKEDMKALIDANKTYKESVHNFVKAVLNLAKTARADKTNATPSTTGGEE